jgi:hypothetical protein
VILLSAEDDLERTILPRLKIAGADLSRIYPVISVGEGPKGRTVAIPDDLDRIEELALRERVALIVIDPFPAYLTGKHDSHKDADIRRVLHRLKVLAERTGAGVKILRHLNKVTDTAALYRGGGSIGIIAASRTAFVVARHPKEEGVCVIALQKTNLGQQVPSLAYKVVQKPCEVFDSDGKEHTDGVPAIEWLGEVNLTAEELLCRPTANGRSKKQTAEEYLQETLAAGPVPSEVLIEGAVKAGLSPRTLKRARQNLKVVAYQTATGWYSQLPTASPAVPEG